MRTEKGENIKTDSTLESSITVAKQA